MKNNNALLKLKPLLRKPGFTSKEARLLGVSSANLAYYVTQNKLIRIGRGVYRSDKYDASLIDFRSEDLIDAMQKVKNGVICLTTALSLYDLTEEMPSQFWVAVSHQTRSRAEFPIKIVRVRNLTLGKTTIKIGKVTLPIFNREKTIVDAFRYLGRETALKALQLALTKKSKEKINIEKLRKYAKKLRVKIEPFLIAMTL